MKLFFVVKQRRSAHIDTLLVNT